MKLQIITLFAFYKINIQEYESSVILEWRLEDFDSVVQWVKEFHSHSIGCQFKTH